MTALSDQIRDELYLRLPGGQQKALLDVLDLHTPKRDEFPLRHGAGLRLRCAACWPQPYPCPTVAAIAAALGVTGPASGTGETTC